MEKRREVGSIGEKFRVCVLACGDPEFSEVVGRTPGDIDKLASPWREERNDERIIWALGTLKCPGSPELLILSTWVDSTSLPLQLPLR